MSSKTMLAFSFLVSSLFFAACEFHTYPHPYETIVVDSPPIVVVEEYTPPVLYETYQCYGHVNPFHYSPDWCEMWHGGTCCTWDLYDASTCEEEWCWWDDHCGWEYSATICNEVEVIYYD